MSDIHEEVVENPILKQTGAAPTTSTSSEPRADNTATTFETDVPQVFEEEKAWGDLQSAKALREGDVDEFILVRLQREC